MKNKPKLPQKITEIDILAKMDLNLDIDCSEPACMQCLPPAPLKGHKTLNGIMVHSRIDCPTDNIYLLNTDLF